MLHRSLHITEQLVFQKPFVRMLLVFVFVLVIASSFSACLPSQGQAQNGQQQSTATASSNASNVTTPAATKNMSPHSNVMSSAAPRAASSPDHIVIVMEENHSYADIIGSSSAPYINSLAAQGATFTNSHAITHPSEPNYLALFSGSTQGLDSDACPESYTGANLASELIGAGDSFGGYSEDLPAVGAKDCYAPDAINALYARKHNPWVDFASLPASINMPWTSFPTDYSKLPTVSIVVPNQVDDMHSASVQEGDSWLQNHLDGYARWAQTHNSLLIVTWDEDDGSTANQIPTLFVGPMVKTGKYSESIDHYRVLRTIEDIYKLPHANNSANATPINDVWK